jgi:predicted transcriptional regulator
MTQREIAKQFGLSDSAITFYIKGLRHTKNYFLAVALAQLKGTKPIQYINPKLRDIYLAAYPDMNRKLK